VAAIDWTETCGSGRDRAACPSTAAFHRAEDGPRQVRKIVDQRILGIGNRTARTAALTSWRDPLVQNSARRAERGDASLNEARQVRLDAIPNVVR
jgi:hypothetical protein